MCFIIQMYFISGGSGEQLSQYFEVVLCNRRQLQSSVMTLWAASEVAEAPDERVIGAGGGSLFI